MRSTGTVGQAALLAACLGLSACGTEQDRTGSLQQGLTSQCPTTTVEGIDVSQGTGTIAWTQVAGSGRQFAFIKATQGNYNIQSTFPANWANAKASGVLRSADHFFDPTIDGVAQANYFLSQLGDDLGELPPMLDLECPTSSSQSAALADCEYAGHSGWATSDVVLQRALDWLHTVESAVGRRPIVYSYAAWFSTVGVTDPELASYPLFVASHASCASVPAPWSTATFWQYSNSGVVPGITSTPTDLDRFFGTQGELTAFADCAEAGTCAPVDAGTDGSPDAAIGAAGATSAGGTTSTGGVTGAAGTTSTGGVTGAAGTTSTGGTPEVADASDVANDAGGAPSSAAAAGSPSARSGDASGCGCHVLGSSGGAPPLPVAWLFGALVGAFSARRKRRAQRQPEAKLGPSFRE